MTSLWVAFITGLTTGGLSCMAVQGGLLASSLANQIELDIASKGKAKKGGQRKFSPHIAFPIFLFLIAKLIVYTLLGALLGSLGKVLQITPTAQAILQFLIAVFMVGNALRMLNVHPIFRFFVFEPPSFVTRYIRRKSKAGGAWFTPAFLGAMTVLIPCGVTQTMMAAAIASGSPLTGSALMFAFILGTSPVFFALSYFATRLSALAERYFVRIVAAALIVLGILAFDTGLNLLGSPVSLTRMVNNLAGNGKGISGEIIPTGSPSNLGSTLVLNVVNSGYEPQTLNAPANSEVSLKLVTRNTQSCSRAFLIPSLDVQKLLPPTGTSVVKIPPQEPGIIIPFTCSMGMYTGQIVFN